MPARPSLSALGSFSQRAAQPPAWEPGDQLSANLATGNRVINDRRSKMREDYYHTPRTIGGPDFGPEYGLGQPAGSGLGGRFDDFFSAMIGSAANQGKQLKVDWSGFGRTKAYDPALGQNYDLESGEVPPGFREGGGSYTPNEERYIRGSSPAMSALRRATGKSGVL